MPDSKTSLIESNMVDSQHDLFLIKLSFIHNFSKLPNCFHYILDNVSNRHFYK